MRARAWPKWVLFALLGACGDEQVEAVPAVDGSSMRICAPQNMSAWKPTWRPPELPLAACTNAQLASAFLACESSTSTTAECFAWNRDPANAACLQCLYSTEDEPTYGPVIYLKNRARIANIPGCVALLEGDRSAAGCGAELQAYYSCTDAACVAHCTVFEELQRCERNAGPSVCASYGPGNVCGDPSMYAQCLEHDSFEDYYVAFARMFCGMPAADGGSTTSDGGSPRDAGGAIDAGGTVDASLSTGRATREIATSRRWRAPERIVNDTPAGEAIGEALGR